jgi:hypothetical protein
MMMGRRRSTNYIKNDCLPYALYLLKKEYGNGRGYNSKKKGRKYYQYRNWFQEGARYGKILDSSGFYDKQAWCSLKKAWKGYKIANAKGELNKLYLYASVIQRLQIDLRLGVSNFPQLDMFAAGVSQDNVDCIPGERIEDELNLEDEKEQPTEDQDMSDTPPW